MTLFIPQMIYVAGSRLREKETCRRQPLTLIVRKMISEFVDVKVEGYASVDVLSASSA
jgi:hypothetical protein